MADGSRHDAWRDPSDPLPDPPPLERQRGVLGLESIVVIVALILGVLWVGTRLAYLSHSEECARAGRVNCVEVLPRAQ